MGLGICVCRDISETEPYVEGNGRDHCSACNKEIQVGSKGQVAIASGFMPLCSDCGLKATEIAADTGKLAGIIMSPEAKKRFDEFTAKMNARMGIGKTGAA